VIAMPLLRLTRFLLGKVRIYDVDERTPAPAVPRVVAIDEILAARSR
jgi:hypothetical protein